MIAALIAGGVLVALLVGAIFVFAPRPQEVPVAESPTPSTTPTPSTSTTPRPPSPLKLTFDRRTLSITDPSSLWVVVNKLRPLVPTDFSPTDLVSVPVPFANEPFLRQAASDAVVAMFAAFTAETGLEMQAQSAYRSYGTQVSVYDGWVSSLGQTGADAVSARPGHSEHQTGLAIDVSSLPAECALEACFGNTPHGIWLAENGWKFGFIVRYPLGLTPTTGYDYEPWHMRFVGAVLAAEMRHTGVATLEEFFGLPAASDYAG